MTGRRGQQFLNKPSSLCRQGSLRQECLKFLESFFHSPTQIGLNTKKQYLRNMKKDELKIEIKKIIDKVPDDMLEDIYNVLKEFADKTPDSIKLSHNLN
jgi:hypothetical protein